MDGPGIERHTDLSVQPGTTKTTGTDVDWHRMGLQSQLTEPHDTVLKAGMTVRVFFFFYGRIIQTEERRLDQGSIYILEIIQLQQTPRSATTESREAECVGIMARRTIHIVVVFFSWRYNPMWLYFHSPVAGFSLLVFEVS
jgi:hypothetical protein